MSDYRMQVKSEKDNITQIVDYGSLLIGDAGGIFMRPNILNDAAGTVLSVDGLSKRFGGTQAVANVSFDVGAGEIVALLGENGAGKSTLIKMLAGVHTVDQGTFHFDGKPFDPRSSDHGIAFIHQDLGLIEWMTVAENISIMQNGYPRRFGLIDWNAARRTAVEAL
ncbi:MAG: ATP-binding cassette domain-containing protein, partial [Sulfitobacter sp.]